MTAASGPQCGLRQLEALLRWVETVYLMLSRPAQLVIDSQTDLTLPGRPVEITRFFSERFGTAADQLRVFGREEWTLPVASLASGVSRNLNEHAGDVMLGEPRPLIVVPRETPLPTIHRENPLRLTRAGAIVMPTNPGFYHRSNGLEGLVVFIVTRILDHLAVAHELGLCWGTELDRDGPVPPAGSPGRGPTAMTELVEIPLFPLKTVLFPGGPLPLRIFERRYLDMVSRCASEGRGFGVVLILEGAEAGTPVLTHRVGTLARIADFYQLEDGLLGITAVGERRFRLCDSQRLPDGLNVGSVEWLSDVQAAPLPVAFELYARLLEQTLSRLGGLYDQLERRFDDAVWVGSRLLEILPLRLEDKQHCLELDDPLERLEYLKPLVSAASH